MIILNPLRSAQLEVKCVFLQDMPIHKKYDPKKFNLKPLILNHTFILLYCCEIIICRKSCFFFFFGMLSHQIIKSTKVETICVWRGFWSLDLSSPANTSAQRCLQKLCKSFFLLSCAEFPTLNSSSSPINYNLLQMPIYLFIILMTYW